MLTIDIPGHGVLELEHLLIDVNGTIAVGGVLLPGITDALRALGDSLSIAAATADTHGTARALAADAGVSVRIISRGGEGEQKLAILRELDPRCTVAIGNGANDVLMLREAAVGIVVIGAEGAARAALDAADVVVTDVVHALAMLADPRRLVATLRS